MLEPQTILSDGSDATFRRPPSGGAAAKLQGDKLENRVYWQLFEALNQPGTATVHSENYPKASIHRRNTGLRRRCPAGRAVPSSLRRTLQPVQAARRFGRHLAFTTEIKLHVDPCPNPRTWSSAPISTASTNRWSCVGGHVLPTDALRADGQDPDGPDQTKHRAAQNRFFS